jgi:hypothetical protein
MNHDKIAAAVARLNSQLPLKARQQRLTPACIAAHRLVLRTLVEQGRPPTQAELSAVLGAANLKTDLQHLGAADLVVLDAAGSLPLGAYPVTVEHTPHRLTVHTHHLHAMCALDAVSVAPMFMTDVLIESSCHVTHTPIVISMRASEILEVHPGPDVTIGIRWQMPSAVAAHSMCLEMVFLKDRQTALTWQGDETAHLSLFTLPQAVAFGQAFFLPLLEDT